MKETDDLVKLEKKVKKYMDDKRFLHTVGVRYTAACLAMAYGQDMVKAQKAGLLHDVAKQLSDDDMLAKCREYGVVVTAFEEAHPYLLHAKLGEAVAADKFSITDAAILSAIRWHTTGKPAMSVLEQIIFIADYLEPGRNKVEELPHFRQVAFQDLDECCYLILKNTLAYLKHSESEIDDITRDAFAYYEVKHETRRLS